MQFMNASLPIFPESEKLSELLNLATAYQKAKVLFTLPTRHSRYFTRKALPADEVSKSRKKPAGNGKIFECRSSIGIWKKKTRIIKSAVSETVFAPKRRILSWRTNKKIQQSAAIRSGGDLTEHLKNWEYGESKNQRRKLMIRARQRWRSSIIFRCFTVTLCRGRLIFPNMKKFWI